MVVVARILLIIGMALTGSSAFAIGFHYTSIPDDAGRAIEIGIWYPSASVAASSDLGLISQTVAIDGNVEGNALPLVIFSHGNAGWYGDRYEAATLLAQHGIVAISMTYPGDNYKDSSDRIKHWLVKRPIVTSQVLDYALEIWAGHSHLDPSRVGFYGFSAGAYTGLVELGGEPNWVLFAQHCAAYPNEMICRQGGAAYLSSPQAADLSASLWHHDPRFKAAILAAPAFGFVFGVDSLQTIHAAVELWGGSNDANVPFASTVPYLEKNMPCVTAVHKIENAGHYSFLRPCSMGLKAKNPEVCSDAKGFDRAAFQATLNQHMLEFFQSKLIGATR